jgi:outer membrane protein OmpA-like peptidoglycan-associated protein/Tol biopolymer transport system component
MVITAKNRDNPFRARKGLSFLLFTLSFLLFTFNVQAQGGGKAQENFKDALRSFTVRDYKKAETQAKKAMDASPDWMDPYLLLGDIYIETKRYDEAISIYQSYLGRNNTAFEPYWKQGYVYAITGRQEEALETYQTLTELVTTPKDVKAQAMRKIQEINYALEMKKHPVPFEPKNLGTMINSNVDEYFPTFTVDGETMYFTRRKLMDSVQMPGMSGYYHRYNEDIMMSKRLGTQWQKATDVSRMINTRDNEGAMVIAPDGSWMVFTGCERPDGEGSCDLYIAFFQEGGWTKPVNMGAPINTRFKETQPSISYDGRSIYFSSNRPGTIGNLDLWITTRDENWNFSEPKNLGKNINTANEEQAPFIHPDDQTLYFCSNGHMGMGMNDIFVARKRDDNTWDSVKNIGYPINTPQDEPGLIVDRAGDYAYMASSSSGEGALDILFFKLPKEARPHVATYLKGRVFDFYSKAEIQAQVELVDLETGQTLIRTITPRDGSFLVPVPSGKDYMVNISAPGYLFHSENIPLKNYTAKEPYQSDIGLRPVKKDEKIALKNIFFATDSYELRPESKSELDRLIKFLQDNASIKLEVSGHTDNSGNAANNKTLSLNRAKAVYDYLVNTGGIAAARLKYAGYGDTQPISDNKTAEGKAKNRRTEAKVIE